MSGKYTIWHYKKDIKRYQAKDEMFAHKLFLFDWLVKSSTLISSILNKGITVKNKITIMINHSTLPHKVKKSTDDG